MRAFIDIDRWCRFILLQTRLLRSLKLARRNAYRSSVAASKLRPHELGAVIIHVCHQSRDGLYQNLPVWNCTFRHSKESAGEEKKLSVRGGRNQLLQIGIFHCNFKSLLCVLCHRVECSFQKRNSWEQQLEAFLVQLLLTPVI